jgi:hypothetical protein
VIAIIEEKKDELFALCRKYHVRTLELFGSATGERFDPKTSDLDFLVDLRSAEPIAHANDYFGLKFDLEALFGRDVDLVEAGAVENPYFLRVIADDRSPVYAA